MANNESTDQQDIGELATQLNDIILNGESIGRNASLGYAFPYCALQKKEALC